MSYEGSKAEFEVYERQATIRGVLRLRRSKTYGWRLRADNGKVVATDGNQGYENRADAEEMGRRVVSGAWAWTVGVPRRVD